MGRRLRRLKRWGAVVAPLGVVVASLVAVGLMLTFTGRPSLPAHIDVGTGSSRVAPSGAPSTMAPSTTVTTAPPTSTSNPRPSGTSASGNAEGTTVVTVVPRVQVEDGNGNPVPDNGSEPAKGRPDREKTGDK